MIESSTLPPGKEIQMAEPRTEPNAIELLTVKILEVAQLHNDTPEGGMVFLPDEKEWGEIVGLARRASTELLDAMEKRLQTGDSNG
jgi:hypothetical protein